MKTHCWMKWAKPEAVSVMGGTRRGKHVLWTPNRTLSKLGRELLFPSSDRRIEGTSVSRPLVLHRPNWLSASAEIQPKKNYELHEPVSNNGKKLFLKKRIKSKKKSLDLFELLDWDSTSHIHLCMRLHHRFRHMYVIKVISTNAVTV